MAAPAVGDTAKTWSGIRDVDIAVGEDGSGSRWPGGPYRKPELIAIGVIVAPTVTWARVNMDSGYALPVFLGGLAAAVVACFLLRLVLPKSRPSLSIRWRWFKNSLFAPHLVSTSYDGGSSLKGARTDADLDPPKQVIGNIRFTASGVTAEYLVEGLAVTMRSLATHERAAKLTRQMGRNLPSGSRLSGMISADDQDRILRNMVGRYSRVEQWVSYCRLWVPRIANPLDKEQKGREYLGPVRRQLWLSIPVDSGREGRTVGGRSQKAWDWIAGRDHDSDQSVGRYQTLAADIIGSLPDEIGFTPATPAQIRWQYRHQVGLGVDHTPMPGRGGPTTLQQADFGRVGLDEGANIGRRGWWPTMRPVVRVYDPANLSAPPSYQSFLVINHFPESGLKFTGAAYLHALDNVSAPAVIDWLQDLTVRTPEQAQNLNKTNAKNIKDQGVQRGNDEDSGRELAGKLRGTREYGRELRHNPSERELDVAVVIAVGADSPHNLEQAVKKIGQELDQVGISFVRFRGSQAEFWKAWNQGSDHNGPVEEFRDPTTAHRWSRFMPLLTERVGNSTGSALAVDQSTMRPRIILHDPEGAAARNHNTGTGVVGDPGSGKSAATKKSGVEKVKRGAQIVAFDPGPLEEWRKAFRHVPGAVAYNPTKDRVCVDFPYEEAGDVAADHLLPMIGVPNHSRMQAEFTLAVRPDHRTGNGIHSSRGLIEYLRRQPNPDENELLIRLEAAAASSYTRAVFDDSREPYRPGGNPATIWLTNGSACPTRKTSPTLRSTVGCNCASWLGWPSTGC
ncbi:hypothetical protein [Mycolicibacterium aubagnense]|uniref:hypothetical protein n=1 Tax=Mycolicibacterium aubagnense TaxID=319707 RepID=UPI001F317CE0|nr:hypothetical protein [Mycolicibacterium aubagnense]